MDNMDLTDLEKEFIASFKALLVRYNVELSPVGGHDEQVDIAEPRVWTLSNNSMVRRDEIFLFVGEIFNSLKG